MAFFCFFLFQAVDCLLNRTRVSDVVEKGTGAPTVEDTGADTNLGPASERKPKAPLSPPPGASKASQNNDVDIIDNEETPGPFEDFVKVDSSVHDFEIESGKSVPSTKCNVKGRLRAHVGFWEDIQAPAFIIDCIKEGYRIPFYVTPAGALFKNNHSALQHAEFVYEAILELVSTNRVVEVAKSHLKIINPLSVSVQNCGKKRLILDLRYVNQHVFKQRFKFEDWRVAQDFFEKGYFLLSLTLKAVITIWIFSLNISPTLVSAGLRLTGT